MRMLARVAMAAVLAASGGCTGIDDPGPAPPRRAFSMAIGPPEHLVPTKTNDPDGEQVLTALFSGLVDHDPATSRPVHVMAESITSADDTLWTITIKGGWTFHDGTLVTAHSFVDTWNFAALSTNRQGNGHHFRRIAGWRDVRGDEARRDPPRARVMSGLKVVDDRTFQVRLDAPFGEFPAMLGATAFYPMPAAALADIERYERHPVGNGPYRMVAPWRRGESITVRRHDGYRGTPGVADEIEFRVYERDDIAAAYADLRRGTLDIDAMLPRDRVADARRDLAGRVVERTGPRLTYLALPLDDDRLDDAKLRRALSLSIDRVAIADGVLGGAATPALSLDPPGAIGARPEPCEACVFDPGQAQRLLREAGGWRGPLRLRYHRTPDDAWTAAVVHQWRTVLGMTAVRLDPVDLRTYDGDFSPGPGVIVGAVRDIGAPTDYDSLAGWPAIPLFFDRVVAAHSPYVGDVSIDVSGRVRVAAVRPGTRS